VLDGVEVVGLDHVESTQTLIVRHPVGSRLPAHATASGQALLAYAPEATRAVIDAGLVALTSRTITEEAALLRELGRVRRRGFAVNVRQWDPETAGVAAPVLNRFGEAIAALGISGPASRMSQQGLLLRLGSVAEAAASGISTQIDQGEPVHHPRSSSAPAEDR
jgi:DNA-binding IclR family transcriptional regulator